MTGGREARSEERAPGGRGAVQALRGPRGDGPAQPFPFPFPLPELPELFDGLVGLGPLETVRWTVEP